MALLQIFFVLSGYLVTRSFLKLYDAVAAAGIYPPPSALPLFVRTYGLWLLLVPMGWACVATLRGREVRGIAFISFWQVIMGCALTLTLAAIFLLSGYRAMMAN